jgi:hypothetical protein
MPRVPSCAISFGLTKMLQKIPRIAPTSLRIEGSLGHQPAWDLPSRRGLVLCRLQRRRISWAISSRTSRAQHLAGLKPTTRTGSLHCMSSRSAITFSRSVAPRRSLARRRGGPPEIPEAPVCFRSLGGWFRSGHAHPAFYLGER